MKPSPDKYRNHSRWLAVDQGGDVIHDTSQYANNRTELSHQPARVRKRGMRRFKSMDQAPRFLSVHSVVHKLFNLGRGMASAANYRNYREGTFK